MKKYLEILKKCPLFYSIEDEDLIRMLSCLGARTESFDKKYTIFAEGSRARYIGILLSGSAHTMRFDYYGNRSILAQIKPADVFAEAFACAGEESLPVSIIANEPSEIMFIDCSHILHTCENHCAFHRQLIYNLMKDLAKKTVSFHKKLEITSKRTTREKLLTYLTHEMARIGKAEFDIPFDRQELADYLEVDRSGLSSEIGRLQKEGIIRNKKNHFEIL